MQVRSFEAVLRAAVETGGRRVAERAVQAVPDVQLAMDGDPLVLGVPHPDGGWVFNVQVPDIMQSYLRIFDAMNAQRRGLRNVTTDAPTALEPDPFAPGKEYAHYVREALIEAMIENSHALNVNSTSELVIVASVPDAVRRNPLDTSRSIILSIRGEYLAAYRQRLISKDDVKSKVVDRRF